MKLGSKKKQELGLMPYGFDYHLNDPIDPEFYAILKEYGLSTSRKKNGDYYDKESQHLWELKMKHINAPIIV